MRIVGQRYTDQEIFVAIQQGGSACDKAIQYLYRKHLEKICSFVTGRNGSREEAKDVFQDAIVNLLVSIQEGKFEGKSSLGTYLYAISKNLWYRRFNRSLKQDLLDSPEQSEEVAEDTPELLLMADHQRELLEHLLDSLKAKCKEVLTMWSQKYSMKEIASQLEYRNEQVVRNKKNHCLKELKSLVRNSAEAQSLVSELVER